MARTDLACTHNEQMLILSFSAKEIDELLMYPSRFEANPKIRVNDIPRLFRSVRRGDIGWRLTILCFSSLSCHPLCEHLGVGARLVWPVPLAYIEIEILRRNPLARLLGVYVNM